MADHPQKYQIIEIDPGEYARWDQFVFDANAAVFYSPQWAQIIRDIFGRPFSIVCAIHRDQIIAGILYWPKTLFGINAITPVPFTPYEGIVYNFSAGQSNSTRIAEFQTVSNILIGHLKKRFKYIDFPLSPAVNDLRPFLHEHFENIPHYTYRFPVTDNLEQQYNSALKRAVKKSLTQSYHLEESKNPQTLISLVNKSYLHHKMKLLVPREQMSAFADSLIKQQLADLFYLTTNDDKTAAALLLLKDNRNIYYLLSGVDRSRQETNPMFILLDSVLKKPENQGKIFDFMGANTPSLEQFKRSFGGQLVPYARIKFFSSPLLRFLNRYRIKQHQRKRISGGK